MLSRHLSSALAFFALMLFGISALAQAPKPSPSQATSGLSTSAHLARAYGKLPLSFQPNLGQTSKQVQWLAQGSDYILFLAGHEAVLEMNQITPAKPGQALKISGAVLRMNLLGANQAQKTSGAELQPGKANYFTGNDSSHWQKNVPLYGQVRLDKVYPGVNLLYHGERGQLEYDFILAPNADPRRITLGFKGATPSIASNGDLLLTISGNSTVRFDKPVAYQMDKGVRAPVQATYELASNGHVSFRLGAYDRSRELVIDPTLVFLGTLGAGNYPYATNLGQITVDSTGAMYFIGTTGDATYPVTSGAYQQVCGPANSVAASNNIVYCGLPYARTTSAYVSKISADGTQLVYSTYLSGGGGYEQGTSIAVDGSGVAYLLGATASNDFPVTADAFQSQCQPAQSPGFYVSPRPPAPQCNNFGNGGGTEYTVNGPEFFFAKLSADGSTLLYSSFLGGSQAAYPVATALDSAGNWYLYGQTFVFTAQNVYTGPNGTGANVQFPGVSASGYQTVSTFVYNNGPENINAAGVLSKFSNDGHTLLYGTFFADETYGENILSTSLAVGANGVAFIGGYTDASGLPTTAGAVKGSCTVAANPSWTCTTVDGYVAAFDTTQLGTASLVYSTRIGGSALRQNSNTDNQEVHGVAADASNDAYVTGYTFDHTFPVPSTGYINACATVNPTNTNNCSMAFVLELNPTGTAILGGSFLGGPAGEYENSVGYKVLLDSKGQVYLYGISQDGQRTFPTVNPVQAQGNGGSNALYITTMTSDLTKALFSTRFGNPNLNGSNVIPVNGLALDPSGNIYFAGTTNDAVFTATPGTYETAANSGGDNHTFFGKISPVLPATATTLAIAPSTANLGQSIVFTATVAGTTQANPVPTGTVTVTNTNTTPATTLGTITLDATGSGTFSTSSLTTGTYSVTASYSGDSNYDVSVSAAQTFTISSIATTATLLTVSPTGALTYGQPVTLTATVTQTGGGTPTGTVTFTDGTATLGTGTLNGSGVATLATSLPVGTDTLAAAYGGSASSASSTGAGVPATVAKANLTVTAANATRVAGAANPTFTGTVTGTVNNDVLTASYTTTATSGSPAGTYDIVPAITGANIGNYNTKLVNGTLTVTAVSPPPSGGGGGGGGGGGAMNMWMLLMLAALALTRLLGVSSRPARCEE